MSTSVDRDSKERGCRLTDLMESMKMAKIYSFTEVNPSEDLFGKAQGPYSTI